MLDFVFWIEESPLFPILVIGAVFGVIVLASVVHSLPDYWPFHRR